MRIVYFSVPVLLILLYTGCSENKEQQSESSSVKIHYIDEKVLEQKISESAGKVLFVNVWATWCLPCVEEFPDLVKIYNEYKDADFEFLSLSVDFGNKADSLVRGFMITQNAEFPVFIVKEESSENIINVLNQEWNGAIPATFIFDKSGTKRSFILGAQNFAYFKESIDSLLIL